MQPAIFDTTPMLRPSQQADLEKDIASAEAKMRSPHIEDKGEVMKQMRRLRNTLETQRARPPATVEEEGRLAARSSELLQEIISDGMCSQAEMRTAPPGAVDKHIAWEKRQQQNVLEWKNIQLRMRPGEDEAADIERYRPIANSLSLDNAVVERKFMFNVEKVTGVTVTFSDDEMRALEALAPDIHATIGTLSNEERGVIKRMLAGLVTNSDKKAA